MIIIILMILLLTVGVGWACYDDYKQMGNWSTAKFVGTLYAIIIIGTTLEFLFMR